MRACTKVCKIALFIEGNNRIFRQILNQFHLIRLLKLLHVFDCLCAGQLKAFDCNVFLCNFFHFFLKGFQFLLCKGFFPVEIIVKAVRNSRADCKFYIRVQVFYRLRQNMGRGMTERHSARFVLKCADADFRIRIYNITQVLYFAVHNTSAGVSCKSFADCLCDIQNRYRAVKFLYNAVLQCNFHVFLSFYHRPILSGWPVF